MEIDTLTVRRPRLKFHYEACCDHLTEAVEKSFQ